MYETNVIGAAAVVRSHRQRVNFAVSAKLLLMASVEVLFFKKFRVKFWASSGEEKRKKGRKEGMKEGRKKGRKEGRMEGRKKERKKERKKRKKERKKEERYDTV